MDTTNNTILRDEAGQYDFSDMDRMCECGHTLGIHSGDRIRVNGKRVQPCFSADETHVDCDCVAFKAVRIRKAKK